MKKVLSMVLAALMLLSVVSFASADEPLKVAVCVSGSLGDQGFYDSAAAGLELLVADFGVVGTVIECKNDASLFESSLIDAAEENDIVVAVGWEFWDGLDAVAPEMPETKFIFVDNGLDYIDNVMAITYAENEGSFLVGYCAMMTSETKVVGFVGGEDSDTINNFLVGYRQGALLADPEGTVLDPIYTNTYDDPAAGKEAALALYSKGADVVFQCADKCGLGVFEAAAEQGKYAIGVDNDQKYLNPDVVICSMLKKVGDSIYTAIANYLENGEFLGGQVWNADLTTGLVSVGFGTEDMVQQISDDTKAEMALLAMAIVAGDIVVEATR